MISPAKMLSSTGGVLETTQYVMSSHSPFPFGWSFWSLRWGIDWMKPRTSSLNVCRCSCARPISKSIWSNNGGLTLYKMVMVLKLTKPSHRTTNEHKISVPNSGRVRADLRQGAEPGERITDSQSQEGLTRTSPDHHLSGCDAKHTHSGRPVKRGSKLLTSSP